MKLLYKNLKKVLIKKISLLATIISIVAIWSLFNYFGNRELVIGNLWYNFYLTEFCLEILISVLFWLFIGTTIYKMIYFSSMSNKNTMIWWIWWFFWILVTGCPACSITLASYLWLASIISTFPFYWIELKVISFFMLVYVVYTSLYTLEVCSIKSKK